ncbi:hypothetical protein CPB83DRAFT_860649 [Crepidotus variabilis]|uniref:DUF6699 domain-containing protein n=1 Tax=Crepidotus variabilis TaxID=179855 RepID=A0A9P6E8N8_9AGAR|nr:hypothetical protein CPB83DRAFT_860649 [Crepidotus variabilis]
MPVKTPKQVRFAYKNTIYPAPPTIIPSFSHSVSTAPSSAGPITPPVVPHQLPRPPYGVPYASSSSKSSQPMVGPPQGYMPPPKTPCSSSRYSGPSRLHPYLEADAMVWDLMESPATIIRNRHHLSSRALSEPATEPPMRFISIVTSYLPWTFKIYASNGHYVSLEDVLETIYRSLRINITQDEFGSFPSEQHRRRATRAYEERYRRLRSQRSYEEEKRAGMKRVDFLMGRTRFVGLSSDGRRPDEWHLRVS